MWKKMYIYNIIFSFGKGGDVYGCYNVGEFWEYFIKRSIVWFFVCVNIVYFKYVWILYYFIYV